MTVLCRDGIQARVQRVSFLGEGNGPCLFGFRMHPADDQLYVDLWDVMGRWTYDKRPHPFDIVKMLPNSPLVQFLNAAA